MYRSDDQGGVEHFFQLCPGSTSGRSAGTLSQGLPVQIVFKLVYLLGPLHRIALICFPAPIVHFAIAVCQ